EASLLNHAAANAAIGRTKQPRCFTTNIEQGGKAVAHLPARAPLGHEPGMTMIEGVAAEGMARAMDASHQLRVTHAGFAEHKECGTRLKKLEHIKNARRVFRVRPIVKRQIERRAFFTSFADHIW